jgi:hypothetical protein
MFDEIVGAKVKLLADVPAARMGTTGTVVLFLPHPDADARMDAFLLDCGGYKVTAFRKELEVLKAV